MTRRPTAPTFDSVDDYIASFPVEVGRVLQEARTTITTAVPDATETISYHMATFNLDGRYLVYLAGWKRHISLHAVPELPPSIEAAVAPLRSGNGTVKFPLDRPLPHDLIAAIVTSMATQRPR